MKTTNYLQTLCAQKNSCFSKLILITAAASAIIISIPEVAYAQWGSIAGAVAGAAIRELARPEAPPQQYYSGGGSSRSSARVRTRTVTKTITVYKKPAAVVSSRHSHVAQRSQAAAAAPAGPTPGNASLH